MIGLDTNLLVRYLTRDHQAQFAKVAQFIDDAADTGEQLLVSSLVLCELAWVLDAVYRYSRAEVADTIERMLETAQFEIERPAETRLALEDVRSTNSSFADALIGRINRALGASHTATFDRDLKRLDTFAVL